MKHIIVVTMTVFVLSLIRHDASAQWTRPYTGQPYYISCLTFDGQNLYAGTSGTSAGGVWRSTNEGFTWANVSPGQTSVGALAATGGFLYAGITSGGGGVFRSSDCGDHWTPASEGIPEGTEVTELAVSGSNLIAGTSSPPPYGIFLSSDNGASWRPGGPVGWFVVSLFATDGYIFAGTLQRLHRSTDNGKTWTPHDAGIGNHAVVSLTSNGTALFAGTDGGGVFRSRDHGVSWEQIDAGVPPNWSAYAVTAVGTMVVAAFMDGPVLSSEDNGATWTDVSSGFPGTTGIIEFVSGSMYLFAGQEIGGVWRRPLAQIATSVPGSTNETPRNFALMQNYPNPFNPSTTIGFKIGDNAFVSLKISDVLGREVATLVNEAKQQGSYEVKWDATGLASGVYFYRLQAGEFTQTKRLLLLR